MYRNDACDSTCIYKHQKGVRIAPSMSSFVQLIDLCDFTLAVPALWLTCWYTWVLSESVLITCTRTRSRMKSSQRVLQRPWSVSSALHLPQIVHISFAVFFSVTLARYFGFGSWKKNSINDRVCQFEHWRDAFDVVLSPQMLFGMTEAGTGRCATHVVWISKVKL